MKTYYFMTILYFLVLLVNGRIEQPCESLSHLLICRKGSDYMFSPIREKSMHGDAVYSGILLKGNDKPYTAWRCDVLNERNYPVVEVTPANKEDLELQVSEIQAEHIFRNLLD